MRDRTITDGVSYNEDTDDYNFNFDIDDAEDIIHLTNRSYNNRISKTGGLQYFLTYRAGEKYIKGQKDVFLRKLKSKQLDDVDYEKLISLGIKYFDDYVDISKFDVIITPKSSSGLLRDMIDEIEKYTNNNVIIIDNLFVKNSIENIKKEVDKLQFTKKTTQTSFNKQFDNATSSGVFKMKDIKFMPFRRLIKNFLVLSDDVEVELVKTISNSRVLVVDDIMSTNTTMLEMSRIIKELNPDEIFGYVLIG